ncbi:flagellar hook-associated protein FlgL [Desulfovibrio aminophilus]|uniref:flagellar hook-associated protein FlgL n=1 Tax=Desulfovibrio aminophilus TaxID=81425 RepID=UPI00041C2545|nr:flagellar hook-associated protein FlgL [Desulfovibrio aminophilus]
MRVTQNMLFSNYVYNMNSSLTKLMELNIQSSSMKRVNKPSDDPSGMVRILDHRTTLASVKQYQSNIDTAKGWLNASDENLIQVSNILSQAKALAEQAATGTITQDNREQISYQVRSLFEQLVGLANLQYDGKSVYAGQKTDAPAFREVLWLTTNDRQFSQECGFSIDGDSDRTILVQFYDKTGAQGAGEGMALSDANLGVRYSIDGGRTFLTDGSVTIAGGEATVQLPRSGARLTLTNPAARVKVTPQGQEGNSEGTWLWLRPTAQYMGDDSQDTGHVDVKAMGAGTEDLIAWAAGAFGPNVAVRVDGYLSNGSLVRSPAAMGSQTVVYSYSTDGGVNWVTGNVQPPNGVASNVSLSIAGGLLTIASNGGNVLQPGAQFFVHARSSAIEIDISSTERVRVNEVGMEIFGGIYQNPDQTADSNGNRIHLSSSNASAAFSLAGAGSFAVMDSNASATKNMFEAMGNLIAFLETNNQQGVQQALASLTESQKHILNAAASVGGRENRLTVASTILDGLEFNENQRISSIEDADVSELLTQLSQQEIIYQAVLRSSSMIMQNNLLKYL